MKKLYFLFSFIAIVTMAKSQQLLHESFDYTVDATSGLSAQSGVNWLVVNTGDSILLSSGSLSYTGLEASTGNKAVFDAAGADYYRIFANQTTGTIYTSFLLNVSSLGGMTEPGGYFFGVIQANSTSAFGAAVWTRLSTTAGKYNIGISTRSNSTVSWLANELDPGTTVFVTTAYEINAGTANDVAKIWLNTAAIGVAEPAADAVAATGSDLSSVERVFLRQSNATQTPFIEIDEIRVGTTWTSVTPPPAGGPEFIATSLTDFGNITVGNVSSSQTITLSGANLTGAPGTINVSSTSNNFEVSNDNSTWSGTTTIPYSSATLAATPVYVRFAPQSVGANSGIINILGGGATVDVSVLGTGDPIPAPASPIATAATAIGVTGFTANWNAVPGATGYSLDVYTTSIGATEDTIAGWNFLTNTVANQTADAGNGTNVGTSVISTNTGGTISWPAGPVSGVFSVSSNGWNDGVDAKYWETSFSTSGATNIRVSSRQSGSNTGPRDFKLQYRIGAAGAFTDVPGGTVVVANGFGSGDLVDVELPSSADNQAIVYLRWLMTSNTSINGGVVASGGTSRISQVFIEGMIPGAVIPTYVTGYSDLAVGNVTSYAVTGLEPATLYHYVVRASNAGGVSGNSSEIDVTTSTPVNAIVTLSPIQPFGDVCINTVAGGANSFVITGINLTNEDLVVHSLPGFSYSTSISGPYTNTLTLPQPGGNYTQTIHVQFAPTQVQSYDDEIVVSGGGLASGDSVEVSGSGVNTQSIVTSGDAVSITSTSASIPATITTVGCDAVTGYGVEYSTTSGFASGTQVAGTNLSGVNFSVPLSSLTPSTTYYYKVYIVTASGTTYGEEKSFTTTAPPITLVATTLSAFGDVCTGVVAGPNSFTLTGANLTSANIVVGPLNGFSFSTTANGTYSNTLTITQGGGTFTQEVFVKFTPAVSGQNYNGNIPVSGGGATSFTVSASGTGIHTGATVATAAATDIQSNSVIVGGTIGDAGCSQTQDYGIEYSTVNNFANGSGTTISAGSILENAPFTVEIDGLNPATTYYYKAYATNAGVTTYGAQQSFTTLAIRPGVNVSPNPVQRGSQMRITMSDLTPGYYGVQFINNAGTLVMQKNINIQTNYINQEIEIPSTLNTGMYRVVVVNHEKVLVSKTIIVF